MLKQSKAAFLLLDSTQIYINLYDKAEVPLLRSSHTLKILCCQVLISVTMPTMKQRQNTFKAKLSISAVAHFLVRAEIH